MFGTVCTWLGDTKLQGLRPHLSLDDGGRTGTIVEWRVAKDKQHLSLDWYSSLLLFPVKFDLWYVDED